jgi:chromate transporter
MIKLKRLIHLFLTFAKLGSVSFGGGYAVLSLMEREVVEDKKWVDKEKIIDIFAVSQSLPGAIALNAAAFVGYTVAGIPGAIVALAGNLAPSVLIMTILSVLFSSFGNNPYVEKAFDGIRPVITALVLYAGFKIGKTGTKDAFCFVIACIAFILALYFKISIILIIIGSILLGLLLSLYNPPIKREASETETKEEKKV